MRLPLLALAFLCLLAFAFAQEEPEAPAAPEPVVAAEPPEAAPPADQNQTLAAQPTASPPDANAPAAPVKAGEVPMPSLLEIVFSSYNTSIAGLLLFIALTAYFIRTDKEP